MAIFGRKKKEAAQQRFTAGRVWDDIALDQGCDAVRDGHLAAGLALLRETRGRPECRTRRLWALGNAAIGASRHIEDLRAGDFRSARDMANVD